MSEERIPSAHPACRSLTGVKVLAAGSYVPDAVVTNDHLYQRLVKAGVPTGFVALRYGLLSVAAILCAGPLAHAIGVIPASAVGLAILLVHLVTGARKTRGVPRLAKP